MWVEGLPHTMSLLTPWRTSQYFLCMAQWGCFWQDRPEDVLASTVNLWKARSFVISILSFGTEASCNRA